MDLITRIIALLAAFLAIASTLSLSGDVQEIKSHGSTGNKNYIPYIFMFCNAILSAYFGYFIVDISVMFVNGVNTVIMVYFCLVFYAYSREKTTLYRHFMLMLTCGGIIVVVSIMLNRENAITFLGMLSNLISIVNFASPLTALSLVVRTRDCSSMSFPLAILNFACGFAWTLYGSLIHNRYIAVPSAIGALLSVSQLFLFVVYPVGVAGDLETSISNVQTESSLFEKQT